MKTGKILTAGCIAALLLANEAFALKSDKDQPVNVDANYSKSVQSKTSAVNDPDVTDLDGVQSPFAEDAKNFGFAAALMISAFLAMVSSP